MRWLLAILLLGGCTTIEVARTPDRFGNQIFVTQEDLLEPYESLGIIQTTRRGVLLLGVLDPAATDLTSTLEESFLPEVRKLGGDGVINLRYERTQYQDATRVLFALLFFIPLPTEITVTGEVVRLARAGAAP